MKKSQFVKEETKQFNDESLPSFFCAKEKEYIGIAGRAIQIFQKLGEIEDFRIFFSYYFIEMEGRESKKKKKLLTKADDFMKYSSYKTLMVIS